MNIALFDTREQAQGFCALLRDVDGIESALVAARDGFAVDVLRPADFRAGLIYVLYYVKGLSLDAVSRRPRAERVDILCDHLVHYAQGEGKWAPPDLAWYGARAQLTAFELGEARSAAEQRYSSFCVKRRWWARLWRRFG